MKIIIVLIPAYYNDTVLMLRYYTFTGKVSQTFFFFSFCDMKNLKKDVKPLAMGMNC